MTDVCDARCGARGGPRFATTPRRAFESKRRRRQRSQSCARNKLYARCAPTSPRRARRGFARAPPRPARIAHRSRTRSEETDTMSGKKETVLDLGKYIDKGVRVKLSGGREGASREFRAPIPSVAEARRSAVPTPEFAIPGLADARHGTPRVRRRSSRRSADPRASPTLPFPDPAQ